MVRVWWFAIAVALLLVPVATATTFVRNYESATVAGEGDPTAGGTMVGTGICAGGQDRLWDSAACLNYYVPTAGIDFRGQAFTVTMQDAVHGQTTAALVQFDIDEDGRHTCLAPDVCQFGKGIVTGIVPDAGRMLKVVPFAVHEDASGTRHGAAGQVHITFTPLA